DDLKLRNRVEVQWDIIARYSSGECTRFDSTGSNRRCPADRLRRTTSRRMASCRDLPIRLGLCRRLDGWSRFRGGPDGGDYDRVSYAAAADRRENPRERLWRSFAQRRLPARSERLYRAAACRHREGGGAEPGRARA